MKKLFSILLIIVFTNVFAQKLPKIKGSKNVVSSTRHFDSIKALEISGKIKLNLVASDSTRLEIFADGNLHEIVKTDVSDYTLSVALSKRIIRKKHFELTLYIDSLQTISLMDRSKVEANGNFNSDTLHLELANNVILADFNTKTNALNITSDDSARLTGKFTSSTLQLNTTSNSIIKATIQTDSLVINSADRSKIRLSGITQKATVTAIDASQIDLSDVIVNNAIISAADTSKINTLCKDNLSVSITEKGEVISHGNAAITLLKFTDSAVLRKKE